MQASFGANENAPETAPDAGAPRARAGCVLLLAPHAGEAPADLRLALANRDLASRAASTCHMAMAELVRAAIASGTLEGAIAGRGEALIIVEPSVQPQRALEELLASVEKFLPRAAVWSYDAGAAPRLRRMERPKPEIVVNEEVARRAGAALRNGATSPGEPALRLHRDHDAPEAPAPAGEGVRDSELDDGAGLLSPEELSMLLAEDGADAEEGR